MDEILAYFDGLSAEQQEKYKMLLPLYQEWNAKINVISRKDIDNLYTHHVLHSLAIAKFMQFKPGGSILDLGTGGGFPGIPLAIMFPETQFTLIDGTKKKIKVVEEVASALELQNVKALAVRSEEHKGKYDFVVSRAVTKLDMLLQLSRKFIKNEMIHAFPNGILALKGGNLKEEIKEMPKGEYVEFEPIHSYFKEPFFDEKFVVYVQG